MKKTCVRCKKEKEIEEFNKLRKNFDGYNNTCRKCRKEIKIKSYYKTYDAEREKKKNSDRKDYKSEWYKKDKKENYDKYRKGWNIQNVERKDYKSEWYEKNKTRIIQENLKKIKKSPKLKLTKNISNGI